MLRALGICVAIVFGLAMFAGMIERVNYSPAAQAAAERASIPTPESRTGYAGQLERSLLERGIDAHVKATGKNKTTLRISWAAMSRPVVYNMVNSTGLTVQAPQLGFTTLIFTDDGSFSGERIETWTYRWNNGWR